MNNQPILLLKQPTVGKLIRDIRLLTGLTQEQFAASLGVTFSTINRWENGRVKPSPLAMKQLDKMLQELGDKGQALLTQYNLQ